MNLDRATIEKLAEHVENAELNRQEIVKITDDYPEMDYEDAYAIQYAIRARKEARGTRVAGLKMGLTSRAKMQQMGVEQPIFGFLTDYGAYAEGAEIDTGRFIHPRVEAEVAVVTKAPLRGPGCHIGNALAAIDYRTGVIQQDIELLKRQATTAMRRSRRFELVMMDSLATVYRDSFV
ncbi:MAG: hypothetical protein ACWGPN_18220, partial [Gammaproteobacteria bacterium]